LDETFLHTACPTIEPVFLALCLLARLALVICFLSPLLVLFSFFLLLLFVLFFEKIKKDFGSYREFKERKSV
jgi:ABC-type transport system involved in cytochrome bd biosynthesis fused ATPase/permease subunit